MSVHAVDSEQTSEELLSDEQLEALAGVDQQDCTRGGTKICTCGGTVTCHHHD